MPTQPTARSPSAEAHDALLERAQGHVRSGLKPLVECIDRDAFYPQRWLQELAGLGGLGALAGPEHGGNGLGLATQIELMQRVASECGATAFTLWCQGASAWYLRQSTHEAARTRWLRALLQGQAWAGSGLSNTIKHLSGFERHFLQATPAGKGWQVSGSLPWVSNLGADHLLATAAQLPDGSYLMFIIPAITPGVQLRACPEFCALEGTRTLNVRFERAEIWPDAVLALPHEFDAYLQRIKPGFILLQMGLALGVIEGCLKLVREAELTRNACNAWLDDGSAVLQRELDGLRAHTLALADRADAGRAPLLDVLRVRLQGSELALRAAQSAALHAGARGYLMRHGAQRRTREALFIAIVTPAIKQLRRDIAQLQGVAAAVPEGSRLAA